jgi:hypothetical protein
MQPIRIRFKRIKRDVLKYVKEHGQLDACDEFKVSLTGLRTWLERSDVVGDAHYGGLTTDTRPLGSTLECARMVYFAAHEYRLSLMKQIQNLKRELQHNEKEIKKWESKILNYEVVECMK